MAVTLEEARNWTTPGAQDAAASTYASIRNALDGADDLKTYDFEVFLQGSYANSTNIRGDSDVDIVVMLYSTFMPDTSRLTAREAEIHERKRIPGTVTIRDFRTDVHAALVSYYGANLVHSKDKCLRVERHGNLIDADVVPAYQVRQFLRYPEFGNPEYVEGIQIRPLSGGSITNFPKEHKRNGEAKNSTCQSRYKPTVRQVKRLANRAADLGLIEKGEVPGYVFECMTFNVPPPYFDSDERMRLYLVVNYLAGLSDSELLDLWSCDKIHRLFDDDPGHHNQYTARRVLQQMLTVL